MNLHSLICLFFLHKEEFKSKNYDAVTDLKKYVGSLVFLEYVLDTVEKEIISNIDKIYKNPVLIDIEFNNEDTKIFVDYKVVFSARRGDNMISSIERNLFKYVKNNETILNIKVDKHLNDDISEAITAILTYYVTSVYDEISILQIDKDKMFNLKEIPDCEEVFQYFYIKYNKYYCAYVKNCNRNNFNTHYHNPMLYYYIERVLDDEVLNVESFSDYTKGDSTSFDLLSYVDYVLLEVYKKLDQLTFFKENFSRVECNNFPECLIFFVQQIEYKSVLKSYLDSLSFLKRKRAEATTAFTCVCVTSGMTYYKKCCGRRKKKNSLYNSFLCKNSGIPVSKEDPNIKEFQSFFSYVFTHHQGVIFKYKEDFVRIINRSIFKTLESIFENAQKKIHAIISFYNTEKLKFNNENYKNLVKELDKKLSPEEKIFIYCYKKK